MLAEHEVIRSNRGCRVFLVEDNPDHTLMAVIILRQLLGDGAEVIVAESADEAVEFIRLFTEGDRPDLMIADLRLPDDGGFEVLAALGATEFATRIPVFVLTSSAYDRDVALSYELGASAVLTKPLSRAALREELHRIGVLR